MNELAPIPFIIKLQSTRSINSKLDTLYRADYLSLKVLEYTYNPFKQYHMKQIPYFIAGNGTIQEHETEIFDTLNLMHTRALTGKAALKAVKDLLSKLSTRNASIVSSIISKDLRCGISSALISKIHPDLIPKHTVMLAKTWHDDMFKPGLVMSIKLDGLRATFKNGKFYSRKGITLQGLTHLEDALKAYKVKNYVLDGELTIPGQHFQVLSGKLRSNVTCPEAVYNIFDIIPHELDTNLITFDKRLKKLHDIFSDNSNNINLVKHVLAKSVDHIHETFKKAISMKYEGLVIKTKDYVYQHKRSKDWLKIKMEHTEDLPIVGFFEGKGKYENQLGGIIVDRKGVHVSVGSGFTDEERVLYWLTREQYLNKIAEVAFHEETLDGSLRHPVFKGYRWDK
jgi:DNA ligase 1